MLFSFAAFAQLDDGTLTIAVSRTINLQPDQAVLSLYLSTDITVTLDDAVNMLQSLGITAANLQSVNTALPYVGGPLPTQWYFSLPVALSSVGDTLGKVLALRQTIAKNGPGAGLNFGLQGTQVSAALQAANPCPMTALVGDAQAQAQKFAAAAGIKVGPIVALSDGSTSGAVGIPTFAFRAGDFVGSNLGSFLLGVPVAYQSQAPAPACTMTVQFKIQQ